MMKVEIEGDYFMIFCWFCIGVYAGIVGNIFAALASMTVLVMLARIDIYKYYVPWLQDDWEER